jgi:hypothetical protein
MTTLDHGLCEPRPRCSGIARSISAPSVRVRPDYAVGRQGLAVDEQWIQGPPRTGDRPATASAPPDRFPPRRR